MIEEPFKNWLPIPEYKDLYEISFSGFEQIWYGYKWKHLVEKVEE